MDERILSDWEYAERVRLTRKGEVSEISEEQELINVKEFLYKDLSFTGPLLVAAYKNSSWVNAQHQLDYMIDRYAESLIAVRRHK